MRAFLCLLCFFGGLAFGDTFFIEDTTGTGIGPEDAIAVLQLVRTSVTDGGHTVSVQRDKAQFHLRPKVMRLGKSYIFSLEKYQGETLLFSTKMKAAEIEELDGIISRVTRAALTSAQADDDARIDDVTHEEAIRGMRRRPARRGSFLAFGPAALSHLNASGLGFYLASAYSWDVNRAMVRLRAEMTLNGGALFSDFGFGASFFLSDRSVAPFIGMDAGFGVARIDRGSLFLNETVSGFTLAPIAGVHLLRTSAINLEIAGRIVFMMKSGSLGSPVSYVLRLGLYF